MRRWATIVFCLCGVINAQIATAFEFKQQLDTQLRYDDRSGRDARYQYRFRYYPELTINDRLSVHAFAVTGNSFGNSHNTLDDGNADYAYVRRLYVRYKQGDRRTELGVIPIYKGRVSSSGLDKDGWISGLRQVFTIAGDTQFEVVFGQLQDESPADALEWARKLDYVEVEFSARMAQRSNFEVSIERMTGGNYVRGEYRYSLRNGQTWFAELIKRIDDTGTQSVFGTSGKFNLGTQPVNYFAYYNYVSDNFGLRAELTEDFLGTGHGFSLRFNMPLVNHTGLSYFTRFDAVEGRTRLMLGVNWSWRK